MIALNPEGLELSCVGLGHLGVGLAQGQGLANLEFSLKAGNLGALGSQFGLQAVGRCDPLLIGLPFGAGPIAFGQSGIQLFLQGGRFLLARPSLLKLCLKFLDLTPKADQFLLSDLQVLTGRGLLSGADCQFGADLLEFLFQGSQALAVHRAGGSRPLVRPCGHFESVVARFAGDSLADIGGPDAQRPLAIGTHHINVLSHGLVPLVCQGIPSWK
jgi:hypothetical protein